MIYFDNAASSPLREEVKAILREELELFANPSSLHEAGFAAEKRMKAARENVAKALNAKAEEIVFTSGGTEADNLAVLSAAKKMRRRGNRILTSDAEHPAVSECMKQLSEEGFEIVTLSTRGGRIDPSEAARLTDEKTALCAVMHTNNETGAVFDIPAVCRAVKEKNPHCLTFSDGVQGFFHRPLCPERLGLDLFSISSHKVHGPKGVGALWVKKGLQLSPRLLGGGQERGLRNGTENLSGIVGFGEACRVGASAMQEDIARMEEIRSYLLKELAPFSRVIPNLPAEASCHVLSLQVEGFRSEVLLHSLSARGIFVSSGSACSSHKGKSPVLKNFGLSDRESDRTVRLSFSGLNTVAEAAEFVKVLKEIAKL
ncbi:MAG: cysteine desulfurase [Clostridia bacterium]|nr:cysteine desulfurase [Clostridia bacterium]